MHAKNDVHDALHFTEPLRVQVIGHLDVFVVRPGDLEGEARGCELGELGVAPLARTIGRARSLFLTPEGERPPKALEDELDRLESKYEIFKIRLFQEYRKYVRINSIVAIALAIILVVIA